MDISCTVQARALFYFFAHSKGPLLHPPIPTNRAFEHTFHYLLSGATAEPATQNFPLSPRPSSRLHRLRELYLLMWVPNRAIRWTIERGCPPPYWVTVLKNTEISINYNMYLKISSKIHSIDPKLRTRTKSCLLKESITLSCIFPSSSTWKSGRARDSFIMGHLHIKGITLWGERHAVRNKRIASDQVWEADAILEKTTRV